MTKKRKKSRPPKRRIKHLISIALSAIIIAAAAFVVYMVFLSYSIDKRFSGRRWDIPSKVYSDTTLLYMGQRINRTLLIEKLGRLGYRETAHPPEHQGEMQLLAGRLTIYLHEVHSPIYHQKNIPVRIRLQGDHVGTITNLETGASIPLLELEPEELMLYYGPNRERRQLLSIRKLPPPCGPCRAGSGRP